MRAKLASVAWLPLIFSAGAASAAAQSSIEQIAGPDRGSASVTQIPAASSTVETEIISSPNGTADGSQLVESSESREAVPQLTQDPGTRAPVQLYRGGPTAQPAEPLSRPADGRRASVVRVEGQDRCDPAAAEDDQRGVCRQVIETRAAEFVPHRPTLSAEQQLLVDQQLREQARSAEAAARRLAERGGDPNSISDQGIAYIVLAEPAAPPERGTEAGIDPSSPSMEAVVGGLIGVPPQ